jgi:hypothetical protein
VGDGPRNTHSTSDGTRYPFAPRARYVAADASFAYAPRSVHTQAVCTAYQLAGDWVSSELGAPPTYVIAPAWSDFVQSLAGLPVSPKALPYLNAPDMCL